MSLCQVDNYYVWIACQDGSIAVCDISTRGITKYFSYDDLMNHSQSLKCMQMAGDGVLVLGYYHGMLAFIRNEFPLTYDLLPSSLLQSIDRLIPNENPSVVTKNLENIGCLNTIEVISNQKQQVIWCGCDKGIIYIVESDAVTWKENFKYYKLSKLKTNPLEVASFSDKLDAEGNIVQLKSTFNLALQKTIVYALHEASEQKSFVISSWQTDQTLQSVIKLDEQGNTKKYCVYCF